MKHKDDMNMVDQNHIKPPMYINLLYSYYKVTNWSDKKSCKFTSSQLTV